MNKTKRVCPGCANSYTPKHGRQHACEGCHRQRSTPITTSRQSRHKVYDSRRWRRVRQQILLRDLECVVCGSVDDLVVDHIGGMGDNPYDPALLRTLCRRCSGRIDGQRGGHRIAG